MTAFEAVGRTALQDLQPDERRARALVLALVGGADERAALPVAPADGVLSGSDFDPQPTPADLQACVCCLIDGSDAALMSQVQRLRRRGVSMSALYLGLFAPAARALGSLWESDVCDFPAVTVGVGRLQRLLRELSPVFCAEPGLGHHRTGVNAPTYRALLVQAPREQHSFGLSMVAEFFRRAGWSVAGGVGAAVADPARRVRDGGFDLVGFSLGSEWALDWLQHQMAAVRMASGNPALVILLGGPLFERQPEWVLALGADGCARDARDAPDLAQRLVHSARAGWR